jgi:hypothetical protein
MERVGYFNALGNLNESLVTGGALKIWRRLSLGILEGL